jgi:hypothetical protein
MTKRAATKKPTTKQRHKPAARPDKSADKKIVVATVPRRKRSEDLRARAAWFQSSAGARKTT